MNKCASIFIGLVFTNVCFAGGVSDEVKKAVENAPQVSMLLNEKLATHLSGAVSASSSEEVKANKEEKKEAPKSETKDTKTAKNAKNTKKRKKSYSYVVRGKRYQVVSSTENFKQVGWASWYGPGFHGKLTANGETFNQHAMTAAHKTLPLGTYVYVTNLKNGKQIKVKINDRGPFAKGRVIDLSKAAAKKLNLIHSGHGKVVISVASR